MLARKGKKFLALLLTLCMVVGMLGTAALAAEGDETGGEPTTCEHVWDEGAITKEATCTEPGEMT